jgi:hypothetical protein
MYSSAKVAEQAQEGNTTDRSRYGPTGAKDVNSSMDLSSKIGFLSQSMALGKKTGAFGMGQTVGNRLSSLTENQDDALEERNKNLLSTPSDKHDDDL